MEIELNKSSRERVLHALAFEIFANIIILFSISFILGTSLAKSTYLSLISAITATSWSYIFNYLFDLAQKKINFTRTFFFRIIHACLFEAILITILTPVAMITLHLRLFDALMLQFSLILFFIPYTIIFNWIYDGIRLIYMKKHAQHHNRKSE
ncbi:PACE efflux transporter [Kluyvera intermedia]|uniref:PACE efflux transporter n=1 Tax=Kluyvera intermedia TaxID=61648 RepID=UPI0034A1665E